jgi:hypothetical protein
MILKFDDSSLLKLPEEDLKKKVELSLSLSGLHLKLHILLLVRLSVLFIKLFNNAPKKWYYFSVIF